MVIEGKKTAAKKKKFKNIFLKPPTGIKYPRYKSKKKLKKNILGNLFKYL